MYKKIGKCIAAIIVILAFTAVTKGFADNQPIKVFIDGEQVQFSQQPIIEKGTTLVPFRPVFEKLGLTIIWDGNSKTVTGSADGIKIMIKINDPNAVVNGVISQLDVPARIINNTTFVPLRFIGEASNKKVNWESAFKQINIGKIDYSYLLSLSNKDKQQRYLDAVKNSDDEQVEFWVKQDHSMSSLFTSNTATVTTAYKVYGNTAANLAAQQDDINIIRLFIANDPSFINSSAHQEAMDTALLHGNAEMADELFKVGIDLKKANNSDTFLTFAVAANQMESVKVVLKYHPELLFAKVDSSSPRSPLQIAKSMGFMDIYNYLISTAKQPIEIPDGVMLDNAQSLSDNLNKYFPYITTNLGFIPVHFSVESNTDQLYPYDYVIAVRYNKVYFAGIDIDTDEMGVLNIFDDSRITNSQKNEYVDAIKVFTEKYANLVIKAAPTKKIKGNYSIFISYVPSWVPIDLYGIALDVFGSHSENFLNWTNYDPTASTTRYAGSHLTSFHFYSSGIDTINLSSAKPLESIKLGTMPSSIKVGEKLQLSVIFSPADATDRELIYSVDPRYQAYISVDSSGMVTGLKQGAGSVWIQSKNNEFIFDVKSFTILN